MQGKIKFNNCARPKKLQNQSQSFFSKCLYVNLKLYELDSYDDDIVRGHLIRHHFMSKYGLLTPYKPQKFLNKQKKLSTYFSNFLKSDDYAAAPFNFQLLCLLTSNYFSLSLSTCILTA